ncbi:MAG: PUR family DNA/RNA-binding protein [Bacteroidales bacterium]|nr:PUR family DNA/RNA-binding protein [Bacteroidales bacterium]
MEGETDKKEVVEKVERQEIFSKSLRAGKRTYFFDVKATRRNDYYLTITESKKRFNKDGRFHYEKHKIFLYKEDFDAFMEYLEEVVSYIKTANPQTVDHTGSYDDEAADDYTNVEFDDLEGVESSGTNLEKKE